MLDEVDPLGIETRTSEADLETVRRFAAALDCEDYATAGRLLASGCSYRIAGTVLKGSEAILASYRASGEWARGHIERVVYESRVRPAGERNAVIGFRDLLEHAGLGHTHLCEQHVELDEQGRICSILHHDLPGEPEALADFFERAGVKRR